MAYLVGAVLAACVSLMARRVGFDRDRAFYPTVLIVIASYYVLFAVIDGSVNVLFVESTIMTGFVIVAVFGFTRSAWIVAVGLAGHGVLDAVHGLVVTNRGVPAWWPAFCLAYDLTAATYLVWLMKGPDVDARVRWP